MWSPFRVRVNDWTTLGIDIDIHDWDTFRNGDLHIAEVVEWGLQSFSVEEGPAVTILSAPYSNKENNSLRFSVQGID